eukprot:COSAG01_NODE_18694_length_1059_cov_2.004167_1_plen_69_part_00
MLMAAGVEASGGVNVIGGGREREGAGTRTRVCPLFFGIFCGPAQGLFWAAAMGDNVSQRDAAGGVGSH